MAQDRSREAPLKPVAEDSAEVRVAGDIFNEVFDAKKPKESLGLDLADFGEEVYVVRVAPWSVANGRLFKFDSILAVNDVHLIGARFTSLEIKNLSHRCH